MNSNIKNEIVVSSPKYQQASIKFRAAWLEYMDHEERVKYEVVNLVTILEKDGMTRMKALQKIVNDHKDLEGFSQKTIYRQLPEDMKNKELGRPNLSRDKLVQTNKSEGNNDDQEQEEQEITYDSNFVNSLIAENEQLKIENFRLKKDYQELETKYNAVIEPYQVKDSIIVNDQEIPLIITVDPFRRTITVEVDQKEVKELKRF